MIDSLTMGKASEQLVDELFNTSIWNCTRYLVNTNGHISTYIAQNIGQLIRVGFQIGFFVCLVQIMADLVANNIGGNDIHPIKTFRKTIIRIIICAIILAPPVYNRLCINVIAAPCNGIAEAISVKYSDNFREKFNTTFDVIGESGKKKHSIWTSAFWEQMTTSLVAGLVYIVAAAFTYIMPILQSILFLFAFYLGPLCLPFMLCDLTSSIAKGWLSLMLTTAFMSVVGALSFMVADTANIISRMQAGGGWENVLIMSVYGGISLVLFSFSFPIAAFLFNAQGSVGSLMNPASHVSSLSRNAMSVSAISAGLASMMLRGGSKFASSRGKEKFANVLGSMSDSLLNSADMFERRGRGSYRDNIYAQRRGNMNAALQRDIREAVRNEFDNIRSNGSNPDNHDANSGDYSPYI